MATDEITVLSTDSTSQGSARVRTGFDVSVYLSEKSDWTKAEIRERLEQANTILRTCDIHIQRVYFHRWRPTSMNVRVDEYIRPGEKYYDGMEEAAKKSLRVTPLQLFYFNDYLDPFTYGGSVPLAIYPQSGIHPHTFGTAWFPYHSAQRRKASQQLGYSEEAHELGHILMEMGHDHSQSENIMANNSDLRREGFLPEQCARIRIPKAIEGIAKNQAVANALYPVLATHFLTYSVKSYMADRCPQNTWLLLDRLATLGLTEGRQVQVVYASPKNLTEGLIPQRPRSRNSIWRYHVFLLVDGMVLDLDFTQKPQLILLEDYLNQMWGAPQLPHMTFQIRGMNAERDLTYLEFRKSLSDAAFPTLSAEELVQLFTYSHTDKIQP